jgi:hypothetical protein
LACDLLPEKSSGLLLNPPFLENNMGFFHFFSEEEVSTEDM